MNIQLGVPSFHNHAYFFEAYEINVYINETLRLEVTWEWGGRNLEIKYVYNHSQQVAK